MTKFPRLVQCAATGTFTTEDAAREIDALVPTLPSECRTPRRKAVSEKATTDPASRCDVSYISTPSVDHEREIVTPGGVVLDVFDKNRIVLYQHDQGAPCGKCLWVKQDGEKGILAKTYYPERPERYEGEWLPEKIWGLIQADILRGKSITFLGLEQTDPDENQKAAGAEIVFSKSLLLEYSVVALPCCPDALVQAVEKGLNLDLGLIGMKRTGERVKTPTKRVEIVDRTPEFCRAVAGLNIDADAIAERIISAMRNRGKVG